MRCSGWSISCISGTAKKDRTITGHTEDEISHPQELHKYAKIFEDRIEIQNDIVGAFNMVFVGWLNQCLPIRFISSEYF
jgi:hypothetical protein